jgi:hypothetical protein
MWYVGQRNVTLFVSFIYLFVEIKVDYSLEWFGDIVVSVYQILNIQGVQLKSGPLTKP